VRCANGEPARHEFFYYGAHDLFAIRYQNWKIHFLVKDDWFTGQSVKPTVPQPANHGTTRSSSI
jgi:arylsulfatase